MNERSTLVIVLTALFLGSRIPADIGEKAFYGVLGLGWVAALIWMVIAWRRGEKIFIWQDRRG